LGVACRVVTKDLSSGWKWDRSSVHLVNTIILGLRPRMIVLPRWTDVTYPTFSQMIDL